MQSCKRLEIIIEQGLVDKVIDCLITTKVSGYTLLPNASGSGGRGQRLADDPAGTFTNCIFIVVCESDAEAEAVVAAVRPLLTRSGGVCIVTDAMSVVH